MFKAYFLEFIFAGLGLSLSVLFNFANAETLKEQAEGLIKQQKFAKAIELLKPIQQQQMDVPELHNLVVQIYVVQDQEQQGLDYLTKLIQLYPETSAYYRMRGNVLIHYQHWLSAIEDLDEALALGSQHPNLYFGLYQVHKNFTNLSKALEYLNLFIAVGNPKATDWFSKAQLELRFDNSEQALFALQKATVLEPKNLVYQETLLTVLTEKDSVAAHALNVKLLALHPTNEAFIGTYFQSLVNRKQERELVQYLQNAIQKYQKPIFSFLYGRFLASKQDYTQALKNYRAGLKLQSSSQAELEVAEILWHTDQFLEAGLYLEQLIKKGSTEISVYRRLAFYYNQNDWVYSAEKVLLQGLEIDSNDFYLLQEFGSVLIKRQQWAEAKQIYQWLLTTAPEEPYLHRQLAIIYFNQNRYKQAAEAFEQVLKLAPDTLDVVQHYVNTLFNDQQLEKALVVLEKWTEKNPDASWAHANKAWAFLEQQQYIKALLAIQKAIQLSPNNSGYQKIEAAIWTAREDFPKAAIAWQDAAKLEPENATTNLKLALAWLKLKNTSAALQTLENFLSQNSPNLPIIELYQHLNQQSPGLWNFKDPRLTKAYTAIFNQQFEMAEQLLSKTGSLNGSAELQILLALVDAKPIPQLNEALFNKPTSNKPPELQPWLALYQGWHALALGNTEQALERLKQIPKKAPLQPWTEIMLALAYADLEDHPNAIKAYTQYLKYYPENYWAKSQLALNYSLVKADVLAEKLYLELLQQRPGNPVVVNNLAWLYLTAKDPKIKNISQAMVYVQQLESLSQNSNSLDTIAEAYYQQGQYKKALHLVEQAMVYDRENLDHFKKQKKKIEQAMQQKPALR